MTDTREPLVSKTVLLATFFVRDVVCALDAARIQEVIRLGPLTPVRHAPEEVAGILNLRGRIVTVLDLGVRLGYPAAARNGDSRVFIIEDAHEFIGLLVDRVDEVVEVDSGEWQRPPANLSAGQERYLQAVCRVANRVIAVLDPARISAVRAQ